MTGMVLGKRYEIIEEIGNGGMARVFKAKCRLLNRFVAIKILKPEFAKDSEFLARFNTEAQAAAALSHQNIVSIFDVGRENDIEYIVMEYVEGITLKEYIKKNKMLSWQETVDFSIQICKALKCAHSNGIIHRDIKPQNIIYTPDNILKVTDFGIARAVTTSSITITGNTMGSVHYLSPEQARGGYTDAKSDIYSLGIVMYEMVTGKLPFDGDNPVSVAIKQIQEKPVSPKEYNIALPLAVESIILKAMNKDQSKRYQTANDMLIDLEKAKISPNSELITDNEDDSGQTKKIPVVNIDEKAPSSSSSSSSTAKRPSAESKPDGGGMNKAEKKAVVWAVITSVVLVAALIIGTISVIFPDIFSRSANLIEVPDLIGKNFAEAKEYYKDKDITLTLLQTVDSSEYDKDEIIDQNPKAGKMVKLPIEIEVTVSGGIKEFKLANYERKGFIETKLALEKMGATVKEEREESDTIAEGMIIRTSPGANAPIKEGDTVTLYVSSGAGEKMVLMPYLVGLSLQQAKKTIAENDLLEGEIKEVYSNAPKGEVTEQNIAPNTKVKAYERVNLSISKGKEPNTKSVGITVPQSKDKTSIKVVQDGIVIHDAVHSKSEEAFSLTVSGTGTVNLEVYYDGVLARTMTVNL